MNWKAFEWPMDDSFSALEFLTPDGLSDLQQMYPEIAICSLRHDTSLVKTYWVTESAWIYALPERVKKKAIIRDELPPRNVVRELGPHPYKGLPAKV